MQFVDGRELNVYFLGKVLTPKRNADVCRFLHRSPTLTVAIVKEVGDGGRGAAAPRFGGVDGGEDGRHEPLVAVHSEALLAELGVVVGQAEQVTCGTGEGRSRVCTCKQE